MLSGAWTISRTSLVNSSHLLPLMVAATATVAVYVVLAAFLFSSVLMGQQTLISNGDSADQSFMWLSKIFAATESGNVALSNFSIYSGTSFIGELQTSPLYPLAWLFGAV